MNRNDRELNDEIRGHLEEATDEYIARGMSPEDARFAALRDFGGVTQAAQVYRESRRFAWVEDLVQDLRYTTRRLIKTPGFTFVAIATLALGIGANTAIFSLLDAVVLKPLAVPDADELVTFYERSPDGTPDATGGSGRYLRFSYPRFERLEEALGDRGSIAAVTRSARFKMRLPGDTEPHFATAQLVTGRFFETLRISPARGRLIGPDDARPDRETPVAVISDRYWKRMFNGSDDAVGKTITLNAVIVTIIGVAPPEFVGLWSDSETDLWVPVTLQRPLDYSNNTSTYVRTDSDTFLREDVVAWLNLVARLPRGGRSEAAAALAAANHGGLVDLAGTFTDAKARDAMLAHTLVVEPFSRGFSGLRSRFSDALFALIGMAALVLLVTCANIANLLLARAAGNARDVGIRISLGASTGRLVRQGLTESLTLALLGGAAGLALGEWGSGYLARQVFDSSSPLPQVFQADRRLIVFASLISIATAIVFGLAPALRAVRAGRNAGLATNQRQCVGQSSITGMRSLVVGQLALAVAVMFAAVLLGRTLLNLVQSDPGFATAQLVTASYSVNDSGYAYDQLPEFARRLVAAITSVPGVTSAAVSRCGLVAGCSTSGILRFEGGAEPVTFFQNWVTPEYFKTTGIPLILGRAFTGRDSKTAPPVAIINETAARKFFAGRDPIGLHLGWETTLDTEIVGIARDARTQSLHDAPVPLAYFPADQLNNSGRFTVFTNLDVRVSVDAAAMLPVIREAIRRSEPNLLITDVNRMSRRLERDLNRERLVAILAFSFAALTLLLACLGLYGVLSYGVARRTQEIGVRMALGAKRREVMAIVLGQSARLTIAGIVLGLIAAAASVRYLTSLLIGVEPFDPTTFIVVVATFAIVTMLAAYVPARRATTVDPVIALRSE